jgi:transmembrane sensor
MARERYVDAERDAIHEIAADWFARLQDPSLSMDDTVSWQSWMSADARHAQAFHRIEETWQRFRGMPRPALTGTRILAADRYDGSMAVSDYAPTLTLPRTRGRERNFVGKFALAASVAAMLLCASLAAYWLGARSSIELAGSTAFETAVGENRTVHLQDGSSVALGGHTRVEVKLDAHTRRLTLARGEAFFTVAKDAARPFSVRAGSATLTALGTAFNVRRADDRVVIAVVEGRVLVEPKLPVIQQLPLLRETASKRRRPRPLEAGSQATVDGAGVELAIALMDSAAATAWQTGRLSFEREPLRYVLEDVNRYAAKPVVIGDDTVGELKITGTVLNDNIEGWVSSLESAFGLNAVEEPTRILLTRREGS